MESESQLDSSSGDKIDAGNSQGFVNRPSGPVYQAFGGELRVYVGDGYAKPAYRSDIADILTYYTRIFVGREREWGRLSRLAAQQQPGYLLVEGPAGYGKSALMAQLVQRSELGTWGQPAPRMLYFFIRQQAQRNTPEAFLKAVNAQLLDLLKQPGGVPSDRESLQSQFSQLWTLAVQETSANRPLLLLVDGLDELASGSATIADYLPSQLADYVHVVVTCRPNPDARELVAIEHPLRLAEVLKLQTFDEADIRALLQEHGAQAELIDSAAPRILAMTGGEPLYARFVSQEIARQGLDALTNLEQRKLKDVEEYFREQLKELTALATGALIRDALGVLLVALGGISAEEIAEVLNKPLLEVRTAVQSIQRFLIGETRLELMHAQFRAVVAELFGRREREAYRQQLLAWCRSYQAIGWPSDTHGYILSNYVNHLKEAGNTDELYDVVLAPAFRSAQREVLGDTGITLDNLRTALTMALAADALARALGCVGAYRDTLARGNVAEAIFQAIDTKDFTSALKRAAICSADSEWSQALWLYLAWEAAEAKDVEAAHQAITAIEGAAPTQIGDLCDALMVRTARALGAAGGSDAESWLSRWGQAARAGRLLEIYRVSEPLIVAQHQADFQNLEGQLQILENQAAQGDAEFISSVYMLEDTAQVTGEEVKRFQALLVKFAACPEGQRAIERVLKLTLTNPYPYYRNIAFATLAVATLAAPDTAWVRAQLRRIVRTALYREGVTFTFDLVALLAAAVKQPTNESQVLDSYLAQARGMGDRWGTALRAANAAAEAAYRRESTDESRERAFAALCQISGMPSGYAGYATLTLLALANRCLELGRQPDELLWGGVPLLAAAEDQAGKVRDPRFQQERLLLVREYRTKWLHEPLPDVAGVHAAMTRMTNRDMRLAYIEYLSARWAAPDSFNWENLKSLVPLALSDGTTLDSILGRLVGLRLSQLTSQDLDAAVRTCHAYLATGRPWEYGKLE